MSSTFPQVIGHNVRQRRDALGITAAALGEKVGQVLGKPWPRQTVYLMEAGERSMIANEVLALASILGMTPAQLVTPPIEIRAVHLGATTFDRSIFTLGTDDSPLSDALGGFEADLAYIWSRAGEALQGLNDVRDMLSMLQEQIQGYRQTGEAPPGVVRKLEAKSTELEAKLQRYQSLEDEGGDDDGESN